METDLIAMNDPDISEVAGQSDDVMPGQNLLLDWIRRELKLAKPNVDKYREEYKRARRFFDGKQLSKEDMDVLHQEGRPDNAFNSAQKFIRFITGVERMAPEALMFNAIEEGNERQQILGERATRRYDWAIAQGSGTFERSTAFEDLCIGGMGWMDYSIDYARDPEGVPAMARFSPLESWFPKCDRQNLEGARWRGRETWIDKDEVKARWPREWQIIQASSLAAGHDRSYPHPGKEEYTIDLVETKPMNESQTGDTEKNKLLVMQFEWFDQEAGFYFFDPLEQNDAWMNKSDFAAYRKKLRDLMGLEVTDFVERSSRTYKRQFLLNRRHMLGDVIKLKRFHLNCMTGSYDEEDRIWYGYFRVLIDPQRFANKFFNQIIEITGHTAKGGGFLYEKGSFLANQLEDFKNNFAKPGTSQEVNTGAITGKKIMPKPQGEMPQAAMGLMTFCTQMMDNVTGISPDQFNAAGANVPGVTLRQKGKSALLLLSKEFDALSRFRIAEGDIVMDLLESLSDDRLIWVGDHQDGGVDKLDQELFASRFSLSLDDTERDPNIRKMYQENVMALAPVLIRQGWFLPEILDYALLPHRVKRAIQNAIKQKAENDRMAAQQGIQTGQGKGAPVSPEERQANLQKTQAETLVQVARAERLKSQSKRDETRTIMDALTKAFDMKIEGEKHNIDQADLALDIFQRAVGGGKPKAESRAAK